MEAAIARISKCGRKFGLVGFRFRAAPAACLECRGSRSIDENLGGKGARSTGFLEWFSGTEKEQGGYGIAPATVTGNFNVFSEGRVQVHIPASPDVDPWAR